MRLLRSKRSFSESRDQKGENVTPCDEQLREQESSQARESEVRAGPPDRQRER